MEDSFDKEKVIDCMFDPSTSSILAELEDGEKELSYLAQKCDILESDVQNQLAYLIEYQFVLQEEKDGKIVFSANTEKLTKIVESDDNFGAAVEGLTKMDGFLN